MTLHAVLALLVLASTSAPPAPSSSPDTTARYSSGEALRRYAQGLLFEARGDLRQAQAEYFHAVALEPREPAIARRASMISATLSDHASSLEFAERALALDEGDAQSWWLKGAALANLGRVREALPALKQAVALDSSRVEYVRALASVAQQAGDALTVERAYRRLIWLDEDDGEAWFQLAAASARRRHFSEAESLFARAAALGPLRPGLHLFGAHLAEAMGRWPDAVLQYRQHLTYYPQDRDARGQLIEALLQGGERDEAYRESRRFAEASPQDPRAHELEVELAFASGRPADAQRALRHLLDHWPSDPEVQEFAVGVLVRNDRKEQAVRYADGCTRRRPGDPHAWMLAARARALSGETDRAAERLRQAAALAPDSLAPRAMLGRLYQDAKRYPEAAAVWEEARRRFPETNLVLFELAFCREQTGDLAGAEEAVRDVLKREPDNATALNFLGYLYADHGMNLEESVRLIERALQLDPDNGAYLDSLGWAYYRLGRLQEARAQLERAKQLTGDDPEVLEHLGDVYKDLSLLDLAREHYLKALRADTTSARLRGKLDALR